MLMSFISRICVQIGAYIDITNAVRIQVPLRSPKQLNMDTPLTGGTRTTKASVRRYAAVYGSRYAPLSRFGLIIRSYRFLHPQFMGAFSAFPTNMVSIFQCRRCLSTEFHINVLSLPLLSRIWMGGVGILTHSKLRRSSSSVAQLLINALTRNGYFTTTE